MRAHELRENLDDATGADASSHVDRQAFTRVLIDDRQALELLAVGAGVEHEVISPDLIGTERRNRPRPARSNAPPRPLLRHLKAVLPPDPVRAIRAHRMSSAGQEHLDATIAIAWVLRRSSGPI